MRILILGTGAVEAHIIAKLSKKNELFCMGQNTNPSILKYVVDMEISSFTFENIKNYVSNNKINLVFFGNIANSYFNCIEELSKCNIICIGTNNSVSILDKNFNFYINNLIREKEHLVKYESFLPLKQKYNDFTSLKNAVDIIDYQYVIKCSNLVKVQGKHFDNFSDIESFCIENLKNGNEIVVEEKIEGEEYLLCAIFDSINHVYMPILKTYRYAFDNDLGPITESMGCLSFSNKLPFLTINDINNSKEICSNIHNTIHNFKGEHSKYMFYGTFIKTQYNIKIINFKYKIPDPGFINCIEMLDTNLDKIINNVIINKLDNVNYKNTNTLTKYYVPEGYPADPIKNVQMKLCYFSNINKLIYSGINFTNEKKIKLTGDRTICLLLSDQDTFKLNEDANLYDKYISGPLRSRKDIGIITLKNNNDFLEKTLDHMKKYVKKTYTSNVFRHKNYISYNLNNTNIIMSNADISNKCNFILKYNDTKHLSYIGSEIINISINDSISKRATPLFYNNVINFNNVDSQQLKSLLTGILEQCQKENIVLFENNINELSDVILENKININGNLVSMLENSKDSKDTITVTSNILAIPCEWTNLNIYKDIELLSSCTDHNIDLVLKLLIPISNYSKEINILKKNNITIKSIVNLDKEGILDKILNTLPKNLSINLFKNIINISDYYQKLGNIFDITDTLEIMTKFNCGYGLLIFISPDDTAKCLNLLKPYNCEHIGEVTINTESKVNFITKDIHIFDEIVSTNDGDDELINLNNFNPKTNITKDISEIYEPHSDIHDSRLGLWNSFWSTRNSVNNHMGLCDIMNIATEYFEDSNIEEVEDWGCGNCRLKKYIERFNIRYIGVDGSDTGFQDKIADLVKYETKVDAIYMQHVLEHNSDWKLIFENMLSSFTKKAVLILFTPFSDETRILTKKTLKDTNKFGFSVTVNDIAFKKEDIIELLEKKGIQWSLETVNSTHNYKLDHIFKLSKT